MKVDAYSHEYDDERSGDFRPVLFLPKDKIVVLGLVTTKVGKLESKDELKRRIDEAAKYVPLEQLCLSPQCGFASTAEGNVITLDDEIAKLTLVVETAREVWGLVTCRRRQSNSSSASTTRATWRHSRGRNC